jgi:hypothetical protein
MKLLTALLLIPLAMRPLAAGEKLTPEERIEIVRGLNFEFATAKVLIPRSPKTLEFTSDGKFDKQAWAQMAREIGPAARPGDQVQITKLEIEGDRLLLQLNGGAKGKRSWKEHVQIGMSGNTTPLSRNNGPNAGVGTTIALVFDGGVPGLPAADYKKMLAPILDFERRTATEQALDSLPPEVAAAVKEKRAIVGMDRDQVVMAIGKPRTKQREVKDGDELEDWVYGMPPGKITFVTFKGKAVIKVQDSYASVGGQVMPPLAPR